MLRAKKTFLLENHSKIVRSWGYCYCLAAGIVACVFGSFIKIHGHYVIFAHGARALWATQPVYGLENSIGNGYHTLWTYSPSAGLFFFSLFAYLPQSLGCFLYLSLSALVFFSALWAWQRELFPDLKREHLFWFILSFEVFGSLQVSKVEVITVGIILWSLLALHQGHYSLAGLGLAIVTNWKFQGIPTAGLAMIAAVLAYRTWRPLFYFALWLAIYSALPYLVLPAAYLNECHRVWFSTLGDSITKTWLTYQNIYVFLNKHWGIVFAPRVGQLISASFGVVMAIGVAVAALRLPRTISKAHLEFLLWIAALGGTYSNVFSPMSQSSGYIQWAPLLLYATLLRSRWRAKARSSIYSFSTGVLLCAWFLVSLAYSDVMPKHYRYMFRDWDVKPVGVLLLTFFCACAWIVNLQRTKKSPVAGI